jgi:hypothetical protein
MPPNAMSEALTCLKSEDPRVLTCLSAGVHKAYKKYAEDFLLVKNLTLKNAADAAGFYNDLGFDSISREHPKWIVSHVSPGIVATNWALETPGCMRCVVNLLFSCLGTPTTEAGERLSAPLHEQRFRVLAGQQGSGFFALGNKAQEMKRTRIHEEVRPKVWELTLQTLAIRGVYPDGKLPST